MKRSPRLQKLAAAQRLDEWHHYLPVPDVLIQSNFYVTSVGQSNVRPGEAYPRRKHPHLYHFSWEDGRTLPEFQLLLVTEGQGTFESKETKEISIVAGQAMLICPGVWHRYRPNEETGWTEKWVQFDGLIALQMQEQGIINPSTPVISPPNFRAAEDNLDHLLDIIHLAPTANTMLFSLEAIAVIASVLRETSTRASYIATEDHHLADAVVVSALDYIWTQGRNVLGVPEVVNAVGVTRRTLERHMVAKLGHSVLEEIVNCRFSRAERLLRSTTLPLKLIVNLSGFGSMENMRQVFMSRTKMSPLAYRHFRHPPSK